MSRAAVAVLVVSAVCVWPTAAQEPALEDVLKRAAGYVANFQKQLSGIVAEETYTQRVRDLRRSGSVGPRERQLRSDLLLVRPVGADRYIEFRDAFEVDGVNVRDQGERVTKLFIDPPPGVATQLQRIVE
jgi:hypothetical protein